MKETVAVTDHHPIPWTTKINPIWWLQGDDGWNVPEINNGAPYLPSINNSFLRRVIWFVFRNPLMNFVGFIIGVEDRNYTVTGDAPALATTGKDCSPVQEGWRTAVLRAGFSPTALVLSLAILAVYLFVFIPAIVLLPFTLIMAVGYLPFVSYYKQGVIEFYLGWRPASGGFGLKIVKG